MLKALVALITARASTPTGLLRTIPKNTIYLLRQAIDKAVRKKGAGAALILTGSGEEYCISISPEEMGDQIVLADSFWELRELQVFSDDQAQILRKCCRVLKPGETEK